jgi:hypothetical protein
LVALCWEGALGDADSRCVTLDDWRPTDLPPPMRAASAWTLTSTNAAAKNKEPKLFMSSPLERKIRLVNT